MVILGIDPGPSNSACVVLENGTIRFADSAIDNDEVIAMLRGGLFKPSPDLVACEGIACYGMTVGAETFETCEMIGRIRERVQKHIFHKIYRKDIKMHLCRTMRSKDKHIREALIKIYGDAGTKKNPGPTYGVSSHAWSALAVATYAQQKLA